ncbi:hypothetical protein JYT82_00470 [bacterium AH-315-K20]|nr:hypothetical protein [bacterium AH-315-K20]
MNEVRTRQGMASLPLLGDIPTIPIWPGLLLNLITLAIPFLALQWAFGWIRTIRRSHRCRCLACNYDLNATPSDMPCPECGYMTTGCAAAARSGLSSTSE